MRAIPLVCVLAALALAAGAAAEPPDRKTDVSIQGQAFFINGRPTYAGREFNGAKIEGLLMNARLVQGIFDDLNPETRARWDYPDGSWDPERNTREFIAAMPAWREHGLLAFTINLQGGSPQGYSASQPWHNSAFESDGRLRPAFLARLERILDRADELGMAVILGLFYFGQDERLQDEARPRHPPAGPGPRTDRAGQSAAARGAASVGQYQLRRRHRAARKRRAERRLPA
ncbi:MAG: hypothetical protein MUE50_18565, partial [Pirellulaceae bacterium]|nr:hypothetical protein [Pirellulaceae bacterium]